MLKNYFPKKIDYKGEIYTQNNVNVAKYYDHNIWTLEKFWSNIHFHYGMWNEDTDNLKEALVNTSSYIIDILDLRKEDVVLDAGCGVGGTTRKIAKEIGCKITGITLSKILMAKALQLSKSQIEQDLIDFYEMDYSNTNFSDGSFTKIFALESICHSDRKEEFFEEAFRLLKPDGELLIIDFMHVRNSFNIEEKETLSRFQMGWSIPNLIEKNKALEYLSKIGYRSFEFSDETRHIMKSSQLLHKRAKRGLKWYTFLRKLKLISEERYRNTISTIEQLNCLKDNIWVYGVIKAIK